MNINDIDPDKLADFNTKILSQYIKANPEVEHITLYRIIRDGIYNLKHHIEDPEDKEISWDAPYIQLNYNTILEESPFTRLPLITLHTRDEDVEISSRLFNTLFRDFPESLILARLSDHMAWYNTGKESHLLYLKQDSEEFKKLTQKKQEKFLEKLFNKYGNINKIPTFTFPFTYVLEETKGKQRKSRGSLIIDFQPLYINEVKEEAYYPLVIGLQITGYKPIYWSDEDKREFWDEIDKVFKDSAPQESFDFLEKLAEPEVKPVKKDKKYFSFAIHALKQTFGAQRQLSLFSDNIIKTFQTKYSITPNNNINKINSFGVSLTAIQLRVMEGILKAFSDTNYKGNIDPKNLEDLKQDFTNIPKAYRNIKEIPRIRVTRSDIIKLSNMDVNQRGDVERVSKVIEDFIPKTQFCFYWIRLAYDNKGKPVKDSLGNWKKEEVSMVDTLFKIKNIRDPETKLFKYYEIEPTAVFLDQRENYCVFIPYNWREEVKSLVGEKKASRYTFLFLLFLRYQYEEIRRYNHNHKDKKPYEIKWSYEEIAKALQMPPSVYKRKKDRAYKILDDAYFTAKALNYLIDNKREDGKEILILNPGGYYNPQKKTKELTH